MFIFQTSDWIHEGLLLWDIWLQFHSGRNSFTFLLFICLNRCIHSTHTADAAYVRANNANCYWCADLFKMPRRLISFWTVHFQWIPFPTDFYKAVLVWVAHRLYHIFTIISNTWNLCIENRLLLTFKGQ